MVTQIKELIMKTKFTIRFALVIKHRNKEHGFNNEPLRCLMNSCDDEVDRVLKELKIEMKKVAS